MIIKHTRIQSKYQTDDGMILLKTAVYIIFVITLGANDQILHDGLDICETFYLNYTVCTCKSCC